MEWEKSLLVGLLVEHKGNIWHIAKAIDERRSRLYKMFQRHGIKPSEYRVLNADPR
jgi:transcriptional regulator of acetoin/glycerol metabolism